MSTQQLEDIIQGFGRLYAGWNRETPIDAMRRQWDAFVSGGRPPAPGQDVRTQDVRAAEVPCRWLTAGAGGDDSVVLYLHGGGYQIGSLVSHHNIMARLAKAGGCRVLGVDYRLAPEHRFPAALDDAVAAYRWLLDGGLAPENIAVCGDSAGGGMAVALLTLLRDRGLPLPAAAVAMSPWADMAVRGDSYERNAAADPVTRRATMELMARTYLGRHGDAADPLASPVHADLAGLPPLLIQVGEREVLLDDAVTLADAVRKAGGAVTLNVWPGMIHTFQLFTGRLDEADAAIDEAARFIRARVDPTPCALRAPPGWGGTGGPAEPDPLSPGPGRAVLSDAGGAPRHGH